jgi:hypothetical protein
MITFWIVFWILACLVAAFIVGYETGSRGGYKRGRREADNWWIHAEEKVAQVREQIWRKELKS